ncbi:hypothetical protein GCM10009527_078920 [Actinomadura nitritigenes]|uniref:DUF5318 family protein n=1 Tax=Actinomadura nitritigenes TaxID=134602 RepID=A0ABS3QTV7_9ACTN|nr:DUF5318 family protein [Actinomadura nitritigenes]
MYRVNVSARYIAKIRTGPHHGKPPAENGAVRGDLPARARARPAAPGRAEATAEPAEMGREYGEFRVYVVEVCQSGDWNHLTVSYVLGRGEQRPER